MATLERLLNKKLGETLEPIFVDGVNSYVRHMREPQFLDQFSSATGGTALAFINWTTTKSFVIPVPPLAEQMRIVAKVDHLLSQCDELSARLRERQSTTEELLTATIHHLLNNVN